MVPFIHRKRRKLLGWSFLAQMQPINETNLIREIRKCISLSFRETTNNLKDFTTLIPDSQHVSFNTPDPDTLRLIPLLVPIQRFETLIGRQRLFIILEFLALFWLIKLCMTLWSVVCWCRMLICEISQSCLACVWHVPMMLRMPTGYNVEKLVE